MSLGTYAIGGNGEDGVAIIDVEKPETAKLDQIIQRRWQESDAHASKIARQCHPVRLCLRGKTVQISPAHRSETMPITPISARVPSEVDRYV